MRNTEQPTTKQNKKSKKMQSLQRSGHSKTYMKATLAFGGYGQREVHEGLKLDRCVVAGQTLDRGLKLTLEQTHDDGPVELLMVSPREGSSLMVRILAEVFFLDVLSFFDL